ncbi:MAG: hypothetical protein LV479_09760 [Methylacidiphilales bacterium]|nr:hypothetical protein [Candidatus Methylacidiphilales bacterium]
MNKIKLMVLGLASLLVGLYRGETPLIANEATSRSADHWKRKTAMAIGKPALAEASDEDLEKAHDAHMTAMNAALANDETDAPPGPAEAMAENEKKELEAKLANAASETEKAKKLLADERKSRADLLIANALSEGRILPASKNEWTGKFANDFSAGETALAAETKKLKTDSKTGNLGHQSTAAMANAAERRERVEQLVQEALPMCGNDRDRAFLKVQKDPKNAALFQAMKDPLAKKDA